MSVLSDGGEYQCTKLPFIVQVTVPCVCGHTPWLQSKLVTEAFKTTIKINYEQRVIIY